MVCVHGINTRRVRCEACERGAAYEFDSWWYEEAAHDGAMAERARIVAWLRASTFDDIPQEFARKWAASIERGEHEDKP